MKKLTLALALPAIAVCAVILVFVRYADSRLSNFDADVSFYVHPGDGSSEVLDILYSKADVIHPERLSRVFSSQKVDRFIKPGHYTVNKGNSSIYVARMLNNGWQSPVRLTLSGTIRKTSTLASRIGKQMLCDSADVMEAFRDRAMLDSIGFAEPHLLSLFIPDTYEMWWTASPSEILLAMKKANDEFWTPERMVKAQSLGLDRKTAAVLASIVTAESRYLPELPAIAGVYLNRLASGMPLQADPTVAFCFDYVPQRILKKHLDVDSPYNTYRHRGLPPGPICVPSKESLEAVLNPDFGNGAVKAGTRGCNLYFCANPDFSGTHVFASTLAAHNINARAFQNENTRRHRARLAASK